MNNKKQPEVLKITFMPTIPAATYNELNKRLNRIGKAAFVKFIYPELKNNPLVTESIIASQHDEFASYTPNGQTIRLDYSKWIFNNNLVCEALCIIANSERTDSDAIRLAKMYAKHECPNGVCEL